jgi:hypothetical protein
MPASILPFSTQRANSAPQLPLDELHELDAKLTLLCFSLERCSSADFVDPSRHQLGALAHHALDVQRDFQSIARRILQFVGRPAEREELTLGNPAMERLQRMALFGDDPETTGE